MTRRDAGPIADGIRVGILGAGQLGQMLALAGIPLGMRFKFFSPTASASAEAVGTVVIGEYDDDAALRAFASSVDVVTYEFENVSANALEVMQGSCPVWPPRVALVTSQDRGLEKQQCDRLGIPVAPYRLVESFSDLEAALREIGVPGILKTRRFGYDGKGQIRVGAAAESETAWHELGPAPLVYEGLVSFRRELSVIAVRAIDGSTRCYPVTENHHRDGILRTSFAPASELAESTQTLAAEYARSLLGAFGYVGVFAVELFETASGLLVNEMAPRVHNSGHWTIEGAETSQFENHMRAVCGLPLGSCDAVGTCAMINIIGTHPDVARLLTVPDVHVHLYGKSERPGRKLGHVTVRSRTRVELQHKIAELRAIASIAAGIFD